MPGEKRAKTHIQNSEIQLFIISFSIMQMCTPYELFFAAFLSLRAEKHDDINYVQLYPNCSHRLFHVCIIELDDGKIYRKPQPI